MGACRLLACRYNVEGGNVGTGRSQLLDVGPVGARLSSPARPTPALSLTYNQTRQPLKLDFYQTTTSKTHLLSPTKTKNHLHTGENAKNLTTPPKKKRNPIQKMYYPSPHPLNRSQCLSGGLFDFQINYWLFQTNGSLGQTLNEPDIERC